MPDRSGAEADDKLSNFVITSPYLTKPPPIAIIAAMRAATPAN